jgi:dTDP-glucose 4,6-dehydratase
MKNILITGGLGFIGFNAIQLWKREKPQYNYFVIDVETYAAQFKINEKKKWFEDNNINYFKCNICDEFSINSLITQYKIDTIINFAAESHVDNSISGPNVFFQTNIIGTTILLNLAKQHNLRFHQIGTDEVYGETIPDFWEYDGFNVDYINYPEFIPLVPSSPYSSSKASADMIALSYYKTFGTKVTVSRCTNNFGKYQHPEKLIGTVISKALKNEKIPVYGKGYQRRHWIYVDEHNRAVMNILEKGKIGKIYNIAPPKENWLTNMKLIRFILKTLNKSNDLIEHVTDRLGHDTSYFLHGTDFCQCDKNWKEDMKDTVEWYKKSLI